MLRNAKKYNDLEENIIASISKKDKIIILFFVYNLGMWKYDGLVKLLLNHPKFEPVIVPFAMPENSPSFNHYNQENIINYCKANNIPFKIGYDSSRDEFKDLTDVEPDIVVYTQPYNTGYEKWRIDRYKCKCLFIYTPYGLSVTNDNVLYDTYLNNVAWKIFVSSSIERDVLQRNITYNTHIVVTGASIYDQLINANKKKSPWRDNRKKRIIWAPHHSMDSRYSFSSSNFERIYSDMIMLAQKYQDSIEHFCEKIRAGKNAQVTKDFMIIARIESLIAGKPVSDALERGFAYVDAGADGIMIHSKDKSGEDIKEFIIEFRKKHPKIPIVVVPTTYNHVYEKELAEWGANIVIYANHMLRAAYPAMKKAAETILVNERAKEASPLCMPIKEILELIPGTK